MKWPILHSSSLLSSSRERLTSFLTFAPDTTGILAFDILGAQCSQQHVSHKLKTPRSDITYFAFRLFVAFRSLSVTEDRICQSLEVVHVVVAMTETNVLLTKSRLIARKQRLTGTPVTVANIFSCYINVNSRDHSNCYTVVSNDKLQHHNQGTSNVYETVQTTPEQDHAKSHLNCSKSTCVLFTINPPCVSADPIIYNTSVRVAKHQCPNNSKTKVANVCVNVFGDGKKVEMRSEAACHFNEGYPEGGEMTTEAHPQEKPNPFPAYCELCQILNSAEAGKRGDDLIAKNERAFADLQEILKKKHEDFDPKAWLESAFSVNPGVTIADVGGYVDLFVIYSQQDAEE